MSVLREGLLEGRAIVTSPAAASKLGDALSELGARVEALDPEARFGEEEESVGEWARARAPLHALVYDARHEAETDAVWLAVREVAVGALIGSDAPGKVVLVGPPPSGAPVRAALENLARTLSVEWARFGVTTVMLAPGEATDERTLAEVVAFLCSPAGDYFSGCRLDLR